MPCSCMPSVSSNYSHHNPGRRFDEQPLREDDRLELDLCTGQQEKLEMLFVLSQKLLRWFLDDRRELERLRHALQDELLNEMNNDHLSPTHSINPNVAVAMSTNSTTTTRAQVQTELSMLANMDTGVQTESIETTDRQTECCELEEPLTLTPSDCSVRIVKQTDSDTQTDLENCNQSVEAVMQTELQVAIVDCEVQVSAAHSDECSQTFSQLVDSTVQAASILCSSDGQTQTDSITQTDSGKALTDTGVQVENQYHIQDRSVQVGQTFELIETTIQTEVAVESAATQTLSQPITETETQICVRTSDKSVSTQDAVRYIDIGEQSSESEAIVIQEKLPLEVYFQVHRSVVRLQRIVRGYVTRRRFFKMLNDLVNAN